MPIYEYACPQCHTTFEEWLKSDDAASEHPCPECGAQASRLISNTTFILKGGGWYVTEYGNHKEGSGEVASASHAPDGSVGSSDATAAGADAAPKASPEAASEAASKTSSASGASGTPAAASDTGASPAVSPPPSNPASSAPATSAGA